jgi:PKD repeat protein
MFSVALTGDDGRATATSTTSITVRTPSAPVPGTIAGPAEAVVGAAVTLTAVGASDPDGRPLKFSWNLGDGSTTVSGQSAIHTYVAAGTFSITLTVDDGRATASATTAITIRPAPPVAGVIDGPTTAEVGSLLTFTSHGASDPDGRPLAFSWSFGDGASASGQSVTHAFSSPGTFVVTLTVDDGKATSTVTTSVIVQARAVARDLTGRWLGVIPAMPPSVMFNTDLILTQTGNSLTGVLPDQGFSPGTVNGSIDPATGQITLFVSMGNVILFKFTGSASADLNTLSGSVTGDGFINTPWTMRRQ